MKSSGRTLLIAMTLAACASPTNTRRVVSPTTGEDAWVVECEVGPQRCLDEAKRLCPAGYRTLEGGRAGWYADDEEPFAQQSVQKERRNYLQVGWTIVCNR